MTSLAIFRADAGPDIGAGHVMRCLALAERLVEHGLQCLFACQADLRGYAETLIDGRFTVHTVDGTQEQQALKLRKAIAEDGALLIVDSYRLDEKFESACADRFDYICVIDDLPNRAHCCDVLLDQNLGTRPSDYAACMSTETHYLLGPQYALLRPQFAATRSRALAERRANSIIRRILISMGSFDPDNATGTVLSALENLAADIEVDVVLGQGAPHLDSVRMAASRSKRAVRLHVAVNDMASLMAECDLAISAAGSTSWERCCLGLPTLMVVLAKNQEKIATALEKAGAARILGEVGHVDGEVIERVLRDVLDDPAALSEMGMRASEICDGKGAERVATALAAALGASDPRSAAMR